MYEHNIRKRRRIANLRGDEQPVLLLEPLADHRRLQSSYSDSSTNTSSPSTTATSPPTFPLHYAMFLVFALLSWVVYLASPRAFRKAFCRADRRRHKKYHNYTYKSKQKPVDISVPRMSHNRSNDDSNDVSLDSVLQEAETRRRRGFEGSSEDRREAEHRRERLLRQVQQARLEQQERAGGHDDRPQPATTVIPPPLESTAPAAQQRQSPHRLRPASFSHPAVPQPPSSRILDDTMTRLKGRGIRLVAHGVQCDPKRVWIRFEKPNIYWQTEFPKSIVDSSGHTSTVWMRGKSHAIGLHDVLYIDVGKKTSALLTTSLSADACFSLLTATGSLDLQANSKLERDAIVCCLSFVLDQVHEWRGLYEDSPEPSTTQSTSTAFLLDI